MAISTLIFDFDGTLVDSEHTHELATHKFLKHLHLPMPSGEYVGKGLLEFLHAIKRENPDLTHTIPELDTLFEECFMELAPTTTQPYEKTIELARQAKMAGYNIAIASGSHRSLLQKVSHLFHIQDIFGEHYYSSEDDKAGKPEPDLFLRVAATLKAEPQEILVLEDSHPGYIAAQRANMHLVMMPDPRFSSQLSFHKADILFDTPHNLDINVVLEYCKIH